jgi:SP family sugar:H+ symporter-like MFS transporter
MLALDFFGFLVIMYQAYFLNINSLYCTRFLLGVYLGISSGIIPAYLVSLSPPEMTGLIGSFNQLLITIGISVAYRLG